MMTDFDWDSAEKQMADVTLAERALMVYSVRKDELEREILDAAIQVVTDLFGSVKATNVKVTIATVGPHRLELTVPGPVDLRVQIPLSDDMSPTVAVRIGVGDAAFQIVKSLEDLGRILATSPYYLSDRKKWEGTDG
jgi:hypothetical protein